jgi:hypothetical protein
MESRNIFNWKFETKYSFLEDIPSEVVENLTANKHLFFVKEWSYKFTKTKFLRSCSTGQYWIKHHTSTHYGLASQEHEQFPCLGDSHLLSVKLGMVLVQSNKSISRLLRGDLHCLNGSKARINETTSDWKIRARSDKFLLSSAPCRVAGKQLPQQFQHQSTFHSSAGWE